MSNLEMSCSIHVGKLSSAISELQENWTIPMHFPQQASELFVTCRLNGNFRVSMIFDLSRLSGDEYNASSDIWSVAVMIIELWTKRYPFLDACASPIDLSVKIMDYQTHGFEPIIPRNASPAMTSFLLQTLAADPARKMKGGYKISLSYLTHSSQAIH